MGKTLVLFGLIIAIAAVVLVIKLPKKQEVAITVSPSDTVSLLPTSSSTSSPTPRVSKTPTPTSTPVAHTYTATFTAQGISPSQLNIKVGDTVKFINQDSAAHWPASDPHPTHTICPGFDALRGLAKGESYSFKFTLAKTCPFHDHLNAFNKLFSGTIIVSNL